MRVVVVLMLGKHGILQWTTVFLSSLTFSRILHHSRTAVFLLSSSLDSKSGWHMAVTNVVHLNSCLLYSR